MHSNQKLKTSIEGYFTHSPSSIHHRHEQKFNLFTQHALYLNLHDATERYGGHSHQQSGRFHRFVVFVFVIVCFLLSFESEGDDVAY